ncbi:MAG: LptA/OstA family protein [Rhodoblastus sp.]
MIFSLPRLLPVLTLLALSATPAAAAMLPGASAKDPYTVDASKLEFFEKENKLVYTGNVLATQGPTKVRGSTMIIYLDKGAAGSSNSSVRRVEMKGPVTVAQKDKVGTGDNGVYDRQENKWYLIGNVTFTQGTTVTQGDKLIYDLATNRATVVGRARTVLTPKETEGKKGGEKAGEKPAAER